MVVTMPRQAPRLLNTVPKKKSEPGERIRQLMESLQGGGGGKKELKTRPFAERQRTTAAAVESSRTMAVAEDPQPERETPPEPTEQAIDQAHFLSSDGMHAIDDDPDEEKVRESNREREREIRNGVHKIQNASPQRCSGNPSRTRAVPVPVAIRRYREGSSSMVL